MSDKDEWDELIAESPEPLPEPPKPKRKRRKPVSWMPTRSGGFWHPSLNGYRAFVGEASTGAWFFALFDDDDGEPVGGWHHGYADEEEAMDAAEAEAAEW